MPAVYQALLIFLGHRYGLWEAGITAATCPFPKYFCPLKRFQKYLHKEIAILSLLEKYKHWGLDRRNCRMIYSINTIKILTQCGWNLRGDGNTLLMAGRTECWWCQHCIPLLSLLPQQPSDHQVSYFGAHTSCWEATWLRLAWVLLQYIREDTGHNPCLCSLFFLERKSGCMGPWELRWSPDNCWTRIFAVPWCWLKIKAVLWEIPSVALNPPSSPSVGLGGTSGLVSLGGTEGCMWSRSGNPQPSTSKPISLSKPQNFQVFFFGKKSIYRYIYIFFFWRADANWRRSRKRKGVKWVWIFAGSSLSVPKHYSFPGAVSMGNDTAHRNTPRIRHMREFSVLRHHSHFWTLYHPYALGDSPPKVNIFWWGSVEIFSGRQSDEKHIHYWEGKPTRWNRSESIIWTCYF